MYIKTIVQKVDLDTIGVYWLARVNCSIGENTPIEQVQNKASSEDLNNPSILCIECGGSGQVRDGCFDHHDQKLNLETATKQMSKFVATSDVSSLIIVEFINEFELNGPEAIKTKGERGPFMTDVISGILIKHKTAGVQLKMGAELLNQMKTLNSNPYKQLSAAIQEIWREYIREHQRNKIMLRSVKERIKFNVTNKNRTVGYVESDFVGTIGLIYSMGAEIAIALNPNYKGIRKFTIASNGVKVNSLLPILNGLNDGWGGPPTGTIIGSPMTGIRLTMDEILGIVVKNL